MHADTQNVSQSDRIRLEDLDQQNLTDMKQQCSNAGHHPLRAGSDWAGPDGATITTCKQRLPRPQ